jgi:hypothetical protein
MPFHSKKLIAVAAAFGVALGGGAIATAQSTSADRPARTDRAPLSADAAAKVKAAALERVPGATVDRTEAGGPYGTPYHAHITTTNGTKQVVLVDGQFRATAVQADQGRGGRGGPGGRHGGRGMDTATLAKALGVTEARLTAALQAVRPAKDAARGDRHADEIAAIARSLGESDAAVKAVFDAVHDQGGRGPRGDDAALVAALVKQFSVTQAKAQAAVDAAEAAHRAGHEDRHAAMAAALAKELGLGTAKVQAALDAVRPARPAR